MRNICFAFCVIANPLYAQALEPGRWYSGPTEFTDTSAWVSASSGDETVEAGALCAGDVPYFHFNVPRDVWWSNDPHQGVMRLNIGGETFEGETRYNPFDAKPAWNMRLTEDAVTALETGNRVDASVVGLASVTFGLRGSGAALATALAGCGEGAGFHPDWATYFTLLEPDATGTLQPVTNLAGIPNVSLDAAIDPDAGEVGSSAEAMAQDLGDPDNFPTACDIAAFYQSWETTYPETDAIDEDFARRMIATNDSVRPAHVYASAIVHGLSDAAVFRGTVEPIAGRSSSPEFQDILMHAEMAVVFTDSSGTQRVKLEGPEGLNLSVHAAEFDMANVRDRLSAVGFFEIDLNSPEYFSLYTCRDPS